MEYLQPNKKTTHAKEQAENGKINAETNSHGNKLSTRTNAWNTQNPHGQNLLLRSPRSESVTALTQ